uniref:Uncharacterized protein n=1 Tax=Solanum lycopersicum TaxID=4081 RepID=A0A3Q7HBS3_SOLLC
MAPILNLLRIVQDQYKYNSSKPYPSALLYKRINSLRLSSSDYLSSSYISGSVETQHPSWSQPHHSSKEKGKEIWRLSNVRRGLHKWMEDSKLVPRVCSKFGCLFQAVDELIITESCRFGVIFSTLATKKQAKEKAHFVAFVIAGKDNNCSSSSYCNIKN